MAQADSMVEGHIPFRNHRVWYRIVGSREDYSKYPLLCVHGGPGTPHDYLEPLEDMAGTGRRVIFYDQLGCGKSDRPDDPSMWTVDLFLEELSVVRETLGLNRCHLLGSSWGGMLAMEYALLRPAGLASLVLASAPAAIPQWISEADRLRKGLPSEVQEVLRKHEDAGTTDDPEYQDAMMVFYRQHVCRLDPWPHYVSRAFENMGLQVYITMFGPSEFYATGTLKDWDITQRLPEIQVPTLITSGRYDEATPAIAETTHRLIPDSEWVLFEQSSHMAFAEERHRYMSVLDDFLMRVEQSGSS